MEACLHKGSVELGPKWMGQTYYVRHGAGHADEGIDASETDADTPQPGSGNDLLAQTFVSGRKTKHGTRPIGDPFVDIPVWVGLQPGVKNVETETVKHLGDETSSGLLSVHTDSEGLYASQEEEGVEG